MIDIEMLKKWIELELLEARHNMRQAQDVTYSTWNQSRRETLKKVLNKINAMEGKQTSFSKEGDLDE